MRISIVVLMILFGLRVDVLGKDEGRSTLIKVEIGKVTQVSFPEKVAKIVKGGQTDSVLVEVIDNAVYLLPKNDDLSNVFVTTISGVSYPLDLKISKDHDIHIQIGEAKRSLSPSGYRDPIDLMKDLLLHKDPWNAVILPEQGKVLIAHDQVELTIEKAYEIGVWKAYVFLAKNVVNNSIILPIEQITFPNLLAVSCEQDMLYPQGQTGDSTRIFMISE
jgi:hypothetical protein